MKILKIHFYDVITSVLYSPPGLICKNEFLVWRLIKREALFKGDLFQSLAFASKFDRKSDIIFQSNKLKIT